MGVFGKVSSEETADLSKAIAKGMKELKEKAQYDAFLLESAMVDRDEKDKRINATIKTFDEEERKRRFGSECGKSHLDFNCRF